MGVQISVFESLFSILWGIFEDPPKQFSTVAVSLHIPTSDALQEFQFLHTFTNT